MELSLAIALLLVVVFVFFAFSNPEMRERIILICSILIFVAVASYVLSAGAQSSSGEINRAVIENANNVSNTVRNILEQWDVSN